MAKGRTLKISLQLGKYTIPLVGKVAWARPWGTKGRPAGMEIQLNGSPGVYRRYVRELEEKDEEQGV